MSIPVRLCPQCQAQAALDAVMCGRCGHQFSSQLPPPNQPPMGYNPPPPPPGHYPPGYGYPPPPYGYPPPPRPDWITLPPGTHSPAVALLISLLFTGGGQMYNRQVIKGLTVFIGAMVLALFTSCLSIPVVWILAAVDSYMVGERLQRGETITGRQCF